MLIALTNNLSWARSEIAMMTDHRNFREAFGRLHATASDSTSIAGSNARTGVKIIKISARLWINPDVPFTDYLDMHISAPYTIPKKSKKKCTGNFRDESCYGFLGDRNQYTMCSLYVQIGKLLGVRPQNKKVSMFEEIYRGWSLSSYRGRGVIRTLNEIVDGDQLVLNCGRLYKSSPSTHDYLKLLPSEFKGVVKVSLTSPLGNYYDNDGSPEDKDSSNKLPKVASESGKWIGTVVGGKQNKQINIEVIVISSDDESETSDVEDVTDKWRAQREEERRKKMENADEID
jgi:hypothetical protein